VHLVFPSSAQRLQAPAPMSFASRVAACQRITDTKEEGVLRCDPVMNKRGLDGGGGWESDGVSPRQDAC